MKVFVLIGPDDEVLDVLPTSIRAQRAAEKREGGRTLAWLASEDPQYHRTAEDYRIAMAPAHLAPKPARDRKLRLI